MKKNTRKNNLLMLVDGSNLAYRAFHKFPNIRTLSEGKLGLIYGFIRILHSYINRFKPTSIVISFDTKLSKKSNFRNKLYPDYKATRGTNLNFDYESFNRQLDILRRILVQMGIPIIWDKEGLGYESDDYIADIAINTESKCLIISSDKDFCQLLNKKIKIFNSSKDELIREDNCEEIMGYPPKQHKDMLILTGDNSDNIKGYKGIGPVKAKQFFDTFGSIKGYLSDKSNEFKWVTREGIEDLYKRNRILIDLKYGLNKYPMSKYPLIQKPYNEEKLTNLFRKYAMESFMKEEFILIFKNLEQWQEK